MIDYSPLWATLIKRGLKKADLLGVSSTATIAKLGKNANVETSVIDKICAYLNCEVSDVMRYVPDDEIIRRGGAAGKRQTPSEE